MYIVCSVNTNVYMMHDLQIACKQWNKQIKLH